MASLPRWPKMILCLVHDNAESERTVGYKILRIVKDVVCGVRNVHNVSVNKVCSACSYQIQKKRIKDEAVEEQVIKKQECKK